MPSAVSKDQISHLRSVAQTGFSCWEAKRLASVASWQLLEDGTDAGFLRFAIPIFLDDAPRGLIVNLAANGHPPFAFVPLLYFPEHGSKPGEFNARFQSVARDLELMLGQPASLGSYGYPHRAWDYLYCWWSLPEAELVLVQDEFDIQNGLDLTLWFVLQGTVRKLPLRL